MHMMENPLKANILDILENLLEAELRKFKFTLTDIKLAPGYKQIPRGTLEQATPVMIADLLIQTYGEEYSKIVTHEVLKAINQHNLAKKLNESMENGGPSTEKTSKKKNKRKREDEARMERDKWSQKFKSLNIFPSKKKTSNESTLGCRAPQTSNEKKVTLNQHFQHLIRRLNLDSYYHKKITKASALMISKTSLHGTQPTTEGELPGFFLHKLLVLDYRLRYLVYRGNIDTKSTASQTLSTIESPKELLSFEDLFTIKETHSTTVQTCIHQMDIQMVIFHCADDFTRQYMFTKLSVCQFALPLLVPDPCNLQIEFPLWPLKQVRKSWREVGQVQKIRNYNNHLISLHPTHIVSFLRVGNFVSTSKSQILNSILTRDKHDNFFHHHCRKDKSSCLSMGGMVEICWFCPGGGTEDRFDKCIAFTNLHGNAETYDRQVTFLQKVSSVIVVLLSTSDFNERSRSILCEFFNSPKPLICLFENADNIVNENFSPHKVRIGIKHLNKIELADKITAIITQMVMDSGSPCSLIECAKIARDCEFIVDEDQRHCQEAIRKANNLIKLFGEKKLSDIKKELLPLHGELWHYWCKKDKELYKLREKKNKSIEQYKKEVESEKQKIRCEQYCKYIQLNDLVICLLESLQSQPETHAELYFLQELSMLLDQRTTKELEKLYQTRSYLLAKVQAEKEKHSMRDSLKRWEADLKAVSKEICDSALGIENLLREFGQIYEALEETSSQTNTEFLSLPHITADLMISGIPIELMDGDVCYVPLKWVTAVFDKLSEKLGDKQVFVLSVLGLQNSGKSSLLNALFGVQLSLSGGRSTRGAYMQLLGVEDTLKEQLGFDFVLVVDTEGLRGSQVIKKSQDEENELATFVIGLGNLTLINILEKDLPEIQNSLQIAVHAFLRMKQLKISPRCLFVHQNMKDIAETDQNRESKMLMQERLDKMAVAAAKYEQCSDVSHFNDIIKFDFKTHIYYFAHFWEGYSPMAPPNPCYSHNVQELKYKLFKNAKEEYRGSIMKISELKVRIQDLWKALVSERFIFNFRNTQEVMAMSKLETMYNSWAWELRSHVLHLQSQLTNQIQSEEIEGFKENSIVNKITEKHKAIKQELEKFFQEDQDRDLFAQWKGKFENDLRNLKDELIVEVKTKTQNLFNAKKIQELLKERKVNLEHILIEKIQDLTLSANKKEVHEEELREIFNKIWSENVSTPLSPAFPSAEDPDIDIDLENILLESFKQQPNIVNKIMYRDKKKKFSINYSKHVITFQKFQIHGPIEDFEKDIIDKTTDQIIKVVREIIHMREQQNESYSPSYFYEILQVIHTKAEAASQEGRFALTNRYKLDLALQLFQEAANSFKNMYMAFKRKNNPVLYLESTREEFFLNFNLSYKSCQNPD